MNKKKCIIIIISIALIGMIGILIFFIADKNQALKEQLENVKSHYSTTVVTTVNAPLYRLEDGTYQVVGTLSQNKQVILQSIDITSEKDCYFQIEGTPYYLYYQDVEPTTMTDLASYPYLAWNENVITHPNIALKKDGEVFLSLEESINYPIMKKTANSYYILFQNNLLEISKDQVKEVQETVNDDQKSASYISVLAYSSTQVTMSTWQKQIDYLKTQNYQTIRLEDYQAWRNREVRLPEKSILLLKSNPSSEEVKYLQEKRYFYQDPASMAEWDFVIRNEKSEPNSSKEIATYQVDDSTSLETLQKMLDGQTIINGNGATQIPVINYHFFYDGATQQCTESICLDIKKFEEQLQYLKENGYKTLTMSEFRDWMYGKIELPKKSILLTIDDGALGTNTHLPELLEKYEMHATLFLITSWWPKENYQKSNYLEIESHSYDLHWENYCDQNYKGLCLSKEELKQDLQKSIDLLGTNQAFCYPFYAYNNTLIEAVKEVGFDLAFAGGNQKATRRSDKYRVPRYVIYKNTSLEAFIRMIQ